MGYNSRALRGEAATMSFEEAKQFLRREEDEGNSLYDHLSKVLLKVIIEKVRSDCESALRRDRDTTLL